MGFTPLEGLIMGTRCGDLDPGVLAFLEREDKLSASKSEEMLNKKSGLLGLSGVSSDMREVLRAADQGHQRALIALKAYCYRVRKYIGAYIASMGGLDTVIFTGGVGQEAQWFAHSRCRDWTAWGLLLTTNATAKRAATKSAESRAMTQR
jgi:acetate kinase